MVLSRIRIVIIFSVSIRIRKWRVLFYFKYVEGFFVLLIFFFHDLSVYISFYCMMESRVLFRFGFFPVSSYALPVFRQKDFLFSSSSISRHLSSKQQKQQEQQTNKTREKLPRTCTHSHNNFSSTRLKRSIVQWERLRNCFPIFPETRNHSMS